MASVLTEFISEYSQTDYQTKAVSTDYVSTKRKRRKAIENMSYTMEQIRSAQETAMDNIPENLRGSALYELAEHSIEIMDEVMGLLGEIY